MGVFIRDRPKVGRVAEAIGGLGDREPLDEEGAEGFVLLMGGVGRFEEEAGEVCELFLLYL